MPVAKARSLFGNHSATVLIEAGKVRRLADAEQEAREAEAHRAAAQTRSPIAASDHHATAEPEPELRADAIEDLAPDQHHHGVRHLEGDDDAAVVELGPADLPLEIGRQDAEHLAVDVVDGGGEEQQSADDPPEPADARPETGVRLAACSRGRRHVRASSDGGIASMDCELAVPEAFRGGIAAGTDRQHFVEQPPRGRLQRFLVVEHAADVEVDVIAPSTRRCARCR